MDLKDKENDFQSSPEIMTIQERLSEISSIGEKILAALAVARVATTGQIWRFCGLNETICPREKFIRLLINLYNQHQEI